jgi:hypothetical protein
MMLGLLVVLTVGLPATAWADAFDLYTNRVLEKVAKAKGVKPVEQLTPDLLAENAGAIKGTSGAFLAVRTNSGKWARLLVQPARQKVNNKVSVPILLIERFVTYREDEDQTIVAQGHDVRLFRDFVFSLDLGQVVPANLGGDIRFVVDGDKVHTEPVGKAQFFLLTQPLPEAVPPKSGKLVMGEKFVPQYFTGIYRLQDDGRRNGTLHLKVRDDNTVVGHYYSGSDGKKYEVEGQVGDPHHTIEFKILFPRTVETFRGWMFTGNGRAITGFSRLETREAGFYAVRIENQEKKK